MSIFNVKLSGLKNHTFEKMNREVLSCWNLTRKLVILQEEICCDPIKFAASCLAFVDTE